MSIALPTTPNARKFHIDLLDWGGLLTPGLGGAVQRINRIGMRYALKVELPPLLSRTNGRIWSTALTQAMQQGAVYRVPSDGLVIGAGTSALIRANTAGGTAIPVKGLPVGYQFQVGQWVNFYSGRFFLHAVASATVADASGNADIVLATPVRIPLFTGDGLAFGQPVIEGFLTDPVGWDTMLEPYNQIGFTIAEAR